MLNFNIDAISAHNLAVKYETGNGVLQDYARAIGYYEIAAAKGLKEAHTGLGLIYLNGIAVEKNYVEAKRYFMLAAKQGDHNAQLGLALMYEGGYGIDRDCIQAYVWANLAALTKSKIQLKNSVSTRDRIARGMTHQQIAEAQKISHEFFEKNRE